MSSKKMNLVSRDFISHLPDCLICHILSFVSTKESASTSLLSKRWRYLFTLLPNLDFDDSMYLNPQKKITRRKNISRSFVDFVDGVLDLQKVPLNGFSLKCKDVVSSAIVIGWILKVLARGVVDLDLQISTRLVYPSEMFVSKTLVRLKIEIRDDLIIGVKYVFLPKLKILCLDYGVSEDSFLVKLISGCQALEELLLNNGCCSKFSRTLKTLMLPPELFLSKTLVRLKIGIRDDLIVSAKDVFLPKVKSLCLDYAMIKVSLLDKLMSGCQALEELALNNLIWDFEGSCNVTSRTLKRLILCRSRNFDQNHKSLLFDTPNLVYLEYSDTIADTYPKVNFSSLVEAVLGLRMTREQIITREFSNDNLFEDEMVGSATDFFMGISNVKILYLSNDTLEVLTYCCKQIPKFNNLIQLTIKTDPHVAWESLPALLKNCPKLETLVFDGLHHKFTKCAEIDGCLCKLWEDIPTCLSSSPVKVLKILNFGEIYGYDDDDKPHFYCILMEQINQVKHFLETMPNLEQVILHLARPFLADVTQVSTQLLMHTRLASPNCKLQLIPSNLNMSSSVPFTVSTK